MSGKTALSLGERLFGIETEYGIQAEGKEVRDLVEEARLLVRAWQGPWAGPWDYQSENPRRDMRGFQVARLSYDERDAQFDRGGSHAALPTEEERSDRALPNGARLYNDHGHPEYATPECRTLRDLVAHDRAGERLVQELAVRRAAETGQAVTLFKNNTDFHGASYGCHESYLCARSVPFERLLHGMLPFLVTRQLYAGAGKTGVESGGPFSGECLYQLSQRADFCCEVASVDTLARRPIFNTRDEAHANAGAFRRLHVIVGDANLAEHATALKVGATCAVLELLETGWEPLFRLRDPVAAIQGVSRDPSLRWMVELEDGRTLRAVDLQRIYLGEAERLLAGYRGEAAWVLQEWRRVLDDLEQDWQRCVDRVDWCAKRALLECFIEAEGKWWEDPVIRSLDLEYHCLDPERGLFWALQGGAEPGQMVRVAAEAAVERALCQAPRDTRAALRGELVRRFGSEVTRISWGRVALRTETGDRWVKLPVEWGGPGGGDAESDGSGLHSRLAAAKTVQEALAVLGG
jgi:proteasome accessory factor PafA2